MTTLAVIITSYNWPEALAKVLQGLANQSQAPDEIWIADDGSKASTTQLIERFAEQKKMRIGHVWHEDKGFRAAAIRNRAIHHIKSEYIVFIDGDCVPLPDFVANHRALAQPGYCVVGNRVLLSRKATPLWLSEYFEWPKTRREWWIARLTASINRYAPLIRLPKTGLASGWRVSTRQDWQGAKTCNLAFWRKDLLELNGLDESYSGWGLEDSDLMIRALRYGIKRKNGRFATGVIHLWHKENDRSQLAENQRRLDQLLQEESYMAKEGLMQISPYDHQVAIYDFMSKE
ncbi:MAG: glycosyltransferase family 2 protein [Pseudomonadota bacterium]